MVCLGNICRSPLAEGILAEKCKHLPVLVDSAGTAAYHVGNAPDIRSQQVARIHNINIENQKARQLKHEDLKCFDSIFVMDKENYKNAIKLAKSESEKEKIQLILNSSNPGSNLEVPDPYYGGDDGFQYVFELLDKACEVIKNQLEKDFNE